MKLLAKYKAGLFYAAMAAGLFIYLQKEYAFHFYFIEQNQLFLNTWDYLSGQLMQPGGFAAAVAGFCVQFFLLPYAGAAIITFWLTGVSVLTCLLLRKAAPQAGWLALSLFPAVALLLVHLDFNYLPSGTVACLLALAAVNLVTLAKGFAFRLAGHAIAAVALFCLAGPAYILYVSLAVVYEWFKRPPRYYFIFAVPAGALLTGILSVYWAVCGEYRLIFFPDGYYHTGLSPKPVIYFAWISLFVLLVLAFVLQRRKAGAIKRKWAATFLQVSVILLAVAFLAWGTRAYTNKRSVQVEEFDYYSRTGQWDKIIERTRGKLTNYLILNYANLALMQKGEFGDKLFSIDQHGLEGLVANWDKTSHISIVHSDIYFAMNLVAPAQEQAFEANVSSIGSGNPRILKRLVQTNLIYGAYPVAGKYLDILEQTFAYRGWAANHRRFLYNDAAVEADSLLGGKRKSLVRNSNSILSFTKGIDTEFFRMAGGNPAGNPPVVMAGAICLLSKDVTRFKAMIEQYYGTPDLPLLPTPFQEAVILLAENDPDYWKRFNVSPATANRFSAFKKQVVAANRSGGANSLPSLLAGAFGDTYWYYFMFKNI
ncbi:hypothetical protein FACS1894181_03480 [Bacteroidia bacterium]|nr:hypothetical protein FACS1894181_03480 [Bacteroidia bacterium]